MVRTWVILVFCGLSELIKHHDNITILMRFFTHTDFTHTENEKGE